MKKNLLLFAMFLTAVVFLLAAGCARTTLTVGDDPHYRDGRPGGGPPPWAPAHGYRAKYKYRYYPSVQVYYDPGRNLYFHYSDGQWRMSASLPQSIRMSLGESVSLEMDTERPYDHHAEVVKRYPPGQAKKRGGGKN